MAFSAFLFAGQLMDFQIGLSMASVFDPLTLAQTPITGNLLHLITCAALIRTGGLHELIAAAAASFDTIPPGGAVMGGGLFMSAVGLLGEVVAAGLRIAMPVVASLFVIDVALGILVKTVPQMNVFVVGMPLKMIAGLVILYFIAPSLAFAFHGVYDTARDAVEAVTAGFSP
jgi:flagellar biosynthetic protein FliR